MKETIEVQWHLTPRGWVRGNQVAPPNDRVLTMRCEESDRSVECHEIWSMRQPERIKRLIAQFGPAPEDM